MINDNYEQIKDAATSFLKENFVMALSTANENGPATAPVIFVTDEDLNFYFVTYRISYKAQNLINNPKCSFAIWQFLKMSVQGAGEASIVEDEAKQAWVMDSFADAATKDPNFWAPIFRIKRGDYCIFKIKPTWLRVLDLTHNTVRQQESPFTEIKLS